jgi:hypothetical protein
MRAIGVISDSDARNADSFNDAWHEVTLTLNNLRIMIAAKFFPVLKDLATQFTDWLIKNKPQVEAFANQLARELPGAIVKLRDSFIALKPFVGAFLDTIKFLSENTLLLKLALVGLGAYIVGPFLVSVALLVKSLAGLSLTLLSTPLGWFLVGLAGIAAAIYQIVDNFKMLKATFLEVTGLGKFFGANANPSGNRIVQKANVPDSPKTITKDSNVTVTFQNTPPGTRVQNDRNSTPVDLDIGYQFGDMMGALP